MPRGAVKLAGYQWVKGESVLRRLELKLVRVLRQTVNVAVWKAELRGRVCLAPRIVSRPRHFAIIKDL